jgi:nitrite reductase/ring-hydroxylating ferredoxin subunit
MPDNRITVVEDVPENDTFLFTIRASDETGANGEGSGNDAEEAILVRIEIEDGDGEEVVCWRNYCQHLTDIRLDKGSGVPTRDGEIVCANHGATFELDSGLCTYGPCEGAYLNEVGITVEDGAVYLDDSDYEFVDVGPIERDPTDLSSTSNVEF